MLTTMVDRRSECRVYTTVFSLLLVLFCANDSLCSTAERRLIANLTANYNPDVRPVVNETHVVTVKVDIALNQIIDMDEKNQILKTMVWMRVYWKDEYMTWNPDDYGGIQSIRMLPKYMWKPDITLYNDVGDVGMTTMLDYNIIYYSSGNTAWLAPVQLTSACKLDIANFPHDQQLCNLTFGTWTFHGFDVDLQNKTTAGDDSQFVSNGEWYIEGFPVVRNVLIYGCCPEPYPTLKWTMVLRRRPLFYIFNLLLPCVVIIAITATGFLLPAESGEKVSLMITCMLSLTVFLLLVAETMPPNSESVPWIGIFFATSIILVALSTVICVIILASHHHGTHGRKVPYILRKIVFSWIATIVFKRKLVKDLEVNNAKVHIELEEHPVQKKSDIQDITAWAEKVFDGTNEVESNDDMSGAVLLKILKSVNQLKNMATSKEDDDKNAEEWQLVAIILDQLFFCLFSFIAFVLALYIFTFVPSY